VSGAVRLCFAAVYSLFLGFGLAIGAEAYQKMSGKGIIGFQDYSCQLSHDPNGPWWQKTPGLFWGEDAHNSYAAGLRTHSFSIFDRAAVFTVSQFAQPISMESERTCKLMSLVSPALLEALIILFEAFLYHDILYWLGDKPFYRYKVHQPKRHQCRCWVILSAFEHQNDAHGPHFSAFAVGLISNIYGRFFGGNAFVVMVRKIQWISCVAGAHLTHRSLVFYFKCHLACPMADFSNLHPSNPQEYLTRIFRDSKRRCSSFQWQSG
jgi:hypothetical protein